MKCENPRKCNCSSTVAASLIGAKADDTIWCDSLEATPPQFCPSGRQCSNKTMKCENPRKCNCSSTVAASLIGAKADDTIWCDSLEATPPQFCPSGRQCSNKTMKCENPRKCNCSSTVAAPDRREGRRHHLVRLAGGYPAAVLPEWQTVQQQDHEVRESAQVQLL